MTVTQNMEDRPLYSSRLIENYVRLLRKKYSDVNVDDLLQYAGMEPYEVADQGSWFSQKQINRFHEKLSETTGYESIAREAGRLAASPEAFGVTKQYILGQANPGLVYALISSGSVRMTRSATFKSKKIAANKVEITATPKEGVKEEPFQCENRMGYFESIALVFSSKLPEIEHEECVFKGADVCRYIITWAKTPSALLKRARNYLLLLVTLGCLAALAVSPAFLVHVLLPVSLVSVLSMALIAAHLETRELKDNLSEVFDSTKKQVDQMNENYENAAMTHEFGQAISRHTNTDDMLRHVVQILEGRLDFDRGIILLANANKTRLVFRDGFGPDKKQLESLEQLSFGLDNPERTGVFVRSFREQRPFLINDPNEIREELSSRNVPLLEEWGVQSFICCPITCEGESLGVLAVDNMKSRRALVKSDLNFLTGFAPVIGTSIRNEEEKKILEEQLLTAQRLESLGTMAGGIAHDFNNFLMGIQGRAAIMLTNREPGEKEYDHLKGIEEYVRSAANLTKQLLGFARGGKYDVKPTNMNTVLQKQNGMFGRTMKEVRIHEEYEDDLWIVEVDRGQMEQVLMNLYVNAWQAMPDGGDLYVRSANVTLGEDDDRFYQIDPGRYIKISVTDTGVGMDKETQQRVFEPFFTTKQMGRGTGLGLASTYGIIRNHNGAINVYSEAGEGTSFYIYLPAASEHEAIRIEETPKTIARGTETVLLVDDEEFIIDVGRDLLNQLGYKVMVATGGKEAIDHYGKHHNEIDIVIIDMIMPDLSGSIAFDRLREINPNVKVLLSSGYSIDGQATEILKRGCDGFIQKPFTTSELSQKLREILGPK